MRGELLVPEKFKARVGRLLRASEYVMHEEMPYYLSGRDEEIRPILFVPTELRVEMLDVAT